MSTATRTRTTARKPASLGGTVFALGATYRTIDDSGPKPVWRTLGSGVDSAKDAMECAKKHALRTIWIFDGVGGRRIVSAADVGR